MISYLTRRLLIAVPVLLLVSVLNFALINLVPGDAVDVMISPQMSQADIEQKRADLGLDKPWPVRYVKWMNEVAHGNLGYSFLTRRPVMERISERVGPTLQLTLVSLLLAYLVAIPIGVIAATRQYSLLDYSSSIFALVGISAPAFFLGLLLIYLLSLKAGWFPASGLETMGGSGSLGDRLHHLVLPAIVLGSQSMGAVVRYTRSSMLDVIRQDYVRTARAKGLSERTVVYKHALRNGLIPVITLLGLHLPSLIGGAVITEQVFGWPGMGRLAVEAITQRDNPVLMAITMLTAVMVVAGNLLADALYGFADPRIRYA